MLKLQTKADLPGSPSGCFLRPEARQRENSAPVVAERSRLLRVTGRAQRLQLAGQERVPVAVVGLDMVGYVGHSDHAPGRARPA